VIYLYRCPTCKKESEVELRIAELESTEIKCECGNIMERLITGGVGFILEGTTWARDG
jgi:putative FmdB family regulatory protein